MSRYSVDGRFEFASVGFAGPQSPQQQDAGDCESCKAYQEPIPTPLGAHVKEREQDSGSQQETHQA
jgi:hypothetical protein